MVSDATEAAVPTTLTYTGKKIIKRYSIYIGKKLKGEKWYVGTVEDLSNNYPNSYWVKFTIDANGKLKPNYQEIILTPEEFTENEMCFFSEAEINSDMDKGCKENPLR